MSFEIRPTDTFWRSFRELLPISAQESVLDLMEGMREHPGDFIDRNWNLPRAGVATRPLLLETDEGGNPSRAGISIWG